MFCWKFNDHLESPSFARDAWRKTHGAVALLLSTKKFGEYGAISNEAEKDRLEKYARKLRSDERYPAHMIAYADNFYTDEGDGGD